MQRRMQHRCPASLFIYLFIYIILFCVWTGLGSQDELNLVSKLFDGYNALIRPVKHMNETVIVEIQLALIQLIDVVSVTKLFL